MNEQEASEYGSLLANIRSLHTRLTASQVAEGEAMLVIEHGEAVNRKMEDKIGEKDVEIAELKGSEVESQKTIDLTLHNEGGVDSSNRHVWLAWKRTKRYKYILLRNLW